MIEVEVSVKNVHYWELFPVYREYIKHQYELIHHRTTWYIQLQAFLFTCFAFVVQKRAELGFQALDRSVCIKDARCIYVGYLDVSIVSFCLAAISTSYILYKLIISASMPIEALWNKWGDIWKKLESRSANQAMPLLTGGISVKHAMDGIKLTKKVPLALGLVWMLIFMLVEILPVMSGRSFLQYVL